MAAIGGLVFCKIQNDITVICEMNCEMNMQNYGYYVKILGNTNIRESNQRMAS